MLHFTIDDQIIVQIELFLFDENVSENFHSHFIEFKTYKKNKINIFIRRQII